MTTSREASPQGGYQLVLISRQEEILGELAVAHTADGLPVFGSDPTDYDLRRSILAAEHQQSIAQQPDFEAKMDSRRAKVWAICRVIAQRAKPPRSLRPDERRARDLRRARWMYF